MPLASVVITSRNRKADVLRAVASAFAQTGVELEVLVYDDASSDGTASALLATWPKCRVFSSAVRSGYITNRNRGFRDALGEIVFSLDDDAYFSAPDIVARTCAIFSDQSVGAVAIPYIEPLNRRSGSSLKNSNQALAGTELRSYVGCAHAVRRSTMIALGGYKEVFFHQKEEGELCLRLWASGWRVVYGNSAPVVHLVKRNAADRNVLYYAGRNMLLAEYFCTPLPEAAVRGLILAAKFLIYSPSLGGYSTRGKGLFTGLIDCWKYRGLRNPLPRSLLTRIRKLKGHGPEDWVGEVPSPCADGSGSLDSIVCAEDK